MNKRLLNITHIYRLCVVFFFRNICLVLVYKLKLLLLEVVHNRNLYYWLSSAGERLTILLLLLLYPLKTPNLWTSEDYRKPSFCWVQGIQPTMITLVGSSIPTEHKFRTPADHRYREPPWPEFSRNPASFQINIYACGM